MQLIWNSHDGKLAKLLLLPTDSDDPLGEYEIECKSVKEHGYLRQNIDLPKLKEHNAQLNVRMLWSAFAAGEIPLVPRSLSMNRSGQAYPHGEDPLLVQASRSFLLVHVYGADGLRLNPETKNLKAILTVLGTDMESIRQESTVQNPVKEDVEDLAQDAAQKHIRFRGVIPDLGTAKWEEAFQVRYNRGTKIL